MTRVCLLAIFPLVNQACSDSPDPLTDIEENKASQIVAPSVPDSIFRFATIEELESVAPEMLADNLSGYKMSEMTYECTDTVDLRALRYDVSATLTSPTGQETTLTFTAEVGPELVSVEYYPTGEWSPAHDNIFYPNFHPRVERYRNYSDGTRIGPDIFYDYGHFHSVYQSTYLVYPLEIFLSCNLSSYGTEPLLDEEKYINGIFYNIKMEQIEINTNMIIISYNGQKYTGEDLVPHIPVWRNMVTPVFSDRFSQVPGNYYGSFEEMRGYMSSWLFPENDEESMKIANMCKDVPDVSSVPYPKDSRSLAPGWYFGEAIDVMGDEPIGFSHFLSSVYRVNDANPDRGAYYGFDKNYDIYVQYLVIDGRIIHYDNQMKDYKGIRNNMSTISETKTADGYNIHREESHKFLGAEFRCLYDLQIKCTKGPAQVIDLSDGYHDLNSGDQEELNKMQTASRSSGRAETPARIERPDGKYMEIDRRLPASIRSLQTKRTLNPDTK